MDFFLPYEQVREKVVYRLVNYHRNRELLREVPHLPYLDLAMVFYGLFETPELGMASVLIRNTHLEQWKMTYSMLYEAAKQNTPRLLKAELRPMRELLGFLAPELEFEGGEPYVLTNDKYLYGAASILYDGILESYQNICQGNFFLLPSSIHEVILLPYDSRMVVEDLRAMIYKVNRTQVQAKEVLSDSLYFYSQKERKLIVV